MDIVMSGSFFLTPGTPRHEARQIEIAEREARHDAEMEERVAAVEAALADDSRDGLRLVELARLLDGESFRMREGSIERTLLARSGPGANDPSRQRAIAIHDRIGRLSVEHSLRKARQVLALVKSWD